MPTRAGVDRADEMNLPSKRISPWLWREIAGDDLDQRRLSGAVVAHQANHFAGSDAEVDAMQRTMAPNSLPIPFNSRTCSPAS